MMHRRFVFALVLVVVVAVPVLADHAWGNYHWARQSNPFTLKVHDNLTAQWESYLAVAAADWSQSSVLDVSVQWNSPLSSTRQCSSAAGRIEICNAKYGYNGWLGIAGISISGDHITKGYTKLNDTYYSSSTYNTPAYRQFVVCQEIGHDFGLDHQDEVFDNPNLGSCMDYTNDPDGGPGGASETDPDNLHPNAHDFAQLEIIYAHLDSTTTISSVLDGVTRDATRPRTIEEILAGAGQWGTPIHFDAHGRPDWFVMPLHEGRKEYVHVLWAPIAIDEPEMERERSN